MTLDDIFNGLSTLGDTFISSIDSLGTLLSSGLSSVSQAIWGFFTWLWNNLVTFFQPLMDFVNGVIYFIEQVLGVVVLVLTLALKLIAIPFALIGGLFHIISSFLSWSAVPSSIDTDFQQGLNIFKTALDSVGGDVIAGVLSFLVWLLIVYAIFRILSKD